MRGWIFGNRWDENDFLFWTFRWCQKVKPDPGSSVACCCLSDIHILNTSHISLPTATGLHGQRDCLVTRKSYIQICKAACNITVSSLTLEHNTAKVELKYWSILHFCTQLLYKVLSGCLSVCPKLCDTLKCWRTHTGTAVVLRRWIHLKPWFESM